jgi:hypothetical protein
LAHVAARAQWKFLDALGMLTYLPQAAREDLGTRNSNRDMGTTITAAMRAMTIAREAATAMNIVRGVIGCAVASGRS